MQSGLELITQNQIDAIFSMYERKRRVELFHWNSGQLAQTGMILNNQVIAAAQGLKNICNIPYRAIKAHLLRYSQSQFLLSW